MKRLGIWGLEIALVLGCAVAAAEASWEHPAAPPGVGLSTAIARWWNSVEKPVPVVPPSAPAARPAAVPIAQPVIDKKPATRPPSQVDTAAAAREQELQDLLRRQKVCLQLMQIALETNDVELLRKAEQLDERARAIYAERTAHLPSGPDGFESDEKTLAKHLGPTNTANRQSALRGRPSNARPTSSLPLREEQP
jgi:hypothetical protein